MDWARGEEQMERERGRMLKMRYCSHMLLSQKVVFVLFREFLQKLQTHVGHSTNTIISTFNHFTQQILRIPYEQWEYSDSHGHRVCISNGKGL